MKTTVKHLSDTKVELTISLGEKELQAAEQVALTKLAKDVKVPGFRKGHAPASVVAKHVSPDALGQQTLDDALSRAVAEAYISEDIQALDRPEVEIKKFVPGQELEFTATTEVLPKVTLGDYKNLTIKKQKVSVTAKDVDEIIDRMLKGGAERKAVERAAKNGDEVVLDFVGKQDGVAFDGGTAEGYSLELGSGQFIPGFEEGVVGHKPGDEFELKLEFPKDYHSKTLAGAKVTFETKLKEVKEIVLPKLDDDFAAKAGPFKTVDELKADIKREITEQKEREAQNQLKDDVVEQLVKVSKVATPEILVADQMRSIEQDMTQNLMYQGLTLDMYLESKSWTKDEWINGEVREAAEKRVKAGLTLAEVSKVEKVTTTDEELAQTINQFQQQYGGRSGQDFTKPEIQRDIANRLLTDKTIDLLVALNTK